MNYSAGFGAPTWLPINGTLLAIFLIWSLFWKGLALWHSGQRGQAWWFVALLIINTASILELIYLFGILKLSPSRLFSRVSTTQ